MTKNQSIFDQPSEEMIERMERAIEEWPWRGKKLGTMELTMDEGLGELVEAFGFDDGLKRGLFLCLVLSRSLRVSKDLREAFDHGRTESTEGE